MNDDDDSFLEFPEYEAIDEEMKLLTDFIGYSISEENIKYPKIHRVLELSGLSKDPGILVIRIYDDGTSNVLELSNNFGCLSMRCPDEFDLDLALQQINCNYDRFMEMADIVIDTNWDLLEPGDGIRQFQLRNSIGDSLIQYQSVKVAQETESGRVYITYILNLYTIPGCIQGGKTNEFLQ